MDTCLFPFVSGGQCIYTPFFMHGGFGLSEPQGDSDREVCATLPGHAVQYSHGHAISLRESHCSFRLAELVSTTKTSHARADDLVFATQQ